MGQKVSKQKIIERSQNGTKRQAVSDPVIMDHPQTRPVFMNSLPSSLSNLDNVEEEEQRQEDPSDYPPDLTIFNKTQRIGRRIKTPTVLFYFDYKSKLFWVLDDTLMKWRYNDLLYARFDSETLEFSRFEEALFRAEFPEYLQYSTLVAVDNKTIHILGKYHLEYKIWSNTFKVKSEKIHTVRWPTVCYAAGNIFCISGEENGEYVNKCQRYIIDEGVWVPFKDVPQAHTFGSACCYTTDDEENNFKLMVIGGYSSSQPKMYNQNISIFDFKADTWTKLTLNIFTRKVPKLVRAPFLQSSEGRLFVFGSEGQWECFEIDVKNEKLKSFGEIPNKSRSSLKDPSPFYVNEKEELVLLLDEMLKNEGRHQKGDSPLVQSIKDLSIWKFHLINDSKEEDNVPAHFTRP